MLNHQLGHDRGHDSSNTRTFNHYGSNNQNQNQNVFPVGGNLTGLQHMSNSYALQNALPQTRGIGNLANNGPQGQQPRFGGQNLPGGLQQYSQVANRSGLPLANGLTNQGMNRGNPSNSGKQGQRMQSTAMTGLGALSPNLQRTGGASMASLNNLNPRNLQSMALGSGQFNMHHLGSPARSGTVGMGGYGSSNGPSSPAPSELLSLIGKSNQGQLANVGQSYAQGSNQAGPSNAMQSNPGGPQASAQEKEQPAFDASEFPALGGASRAPKFTNGERPSSLDGASLYSNLGLHKGILNSEFNIQSEEFPALPGPGSSARPGTDDRQQADQSAQLANFRQEQAGRQDWHRDSNSAMAALSQHQSMQSRFPQSNAANDPDLTTLALGCDLTTLGLPLNSSELVYKAFANPWAEQPIRQEPSFQVPECYKKKPPKLQPGYFRKFQLETLFYIFYSMPGDEAQVYAADELCSRKWAFHKEDKMWLQRTPSTDPVMKTAQMERGSFEIWDTQAWQQVRRDMVLHYESLERPPSLKRYS